MHMRGVQVSGQLSCASSDETWEPEKDSSTQPGNEVQSSMQEHDGGQCITVQKQIEQVTNNNNIVLYVPTIRPTLSVGVGYYDIRVTHSPYW